MCRHRRRCDQKTDDCEPKTCSKVLPYNFVKGETDSQTGNEPKKVLQDLSQIATPYNRKPIPERWWLKEG